jgi:hypothetical protein
MNYMTIGHAHLSDSVGVCCREVWISDASRHPDESAIDSNADRIPADSPGAKTASGGVIKSEEASGS